MLMELDLVRMRSLAKLHLYAKLTLNRYKHKTIKMMQMMNLWQISNTIEIMEIWTEILSLALIKLGPVYFEASKYLLFISMKIIGIYNFQTQELYQS